MTKENLLILYFQKWHLNTRILLFGYAKHWYQHNFKTNYYYYYYDDDDYSQFSKYSPREEKMELHKFAPYKYVANV